MCAVTVVAFWYGRTAYLHATNRPDYYWMQAAITVAAGEELGNPVVDKTTPLYEFLASRRQEITLAEAKTAVVSFEPWDWSQRYLMTSVGYWWRITGIKWSALGDVCGALHVIAVLGVHATLRIFTPLLFSLAGALWMATASLQLLFIPQVRDYSKASFMLATIPLTILLACRGRTRASTFAAAIGAGAVMGIGLGFRRDILVMVPSRSLPSSSSGVPAHGRICRRRRRPLRRCS